MELFAFAVDAVLDVDCGRKLLIGAGEASASEAVEDDLGLQGIGNLGAFVDEFAGAELVAGDGGPLAEEGVVVVSEGLGVV